MTGWGVVFAPTAMMIGAAYYPEEDMVVIAIPFLQLVLYFGEVPEE